MLLYYTITLNYPTMEEYFNGIHSVLIRLEIELYEIKQYLIVSTSQELALTRYQPQHQRHTVRRA